MQESQLVWAERALVMASCLYLYDYALTLSKEWRYLLLLKKPSGLRMFHFCTWGGIRYASIVYQIVILGAMADNRWDDKRCAIFSNATQSFDFIFQISFAAILTRRVYVLFQADGTTVRRLLIWLLGGLGVLSPVVNVAVSNPSIFPRCRQINPAPSTRIILLQPVIRTIFDAVTAVAVLARVIHHKLKCKGVGFTSRAVYEKVIHDGIQDLFMIFSIMGMEAVFYQIPSTRVHARNFIAPFVDTLSAILISRFYLDRPERPEEPEELEKVTWTLDSGSECHEDAERSSTPMSPLGFPSGRSSLNSEEDVWIPMPQIAGPTSFPQILDPIPNEALIRDSFESNFRPSEIASDTKPEEPLWAPNA